MWKEKVQEYEGQIIDDLKGLLQLRVSEMIQSI